MTRVLLAKPGLDGHDKGVKVLATMLRDAGCEVIYTGHHQTPARVALAALQEDVDVVGLSLLSGAHYELTRDVLAELKAVGFEACPVAVGGNIPRPDIERLKALGVKAVFPAGSAYTDIIEWFTSLPTRSAE